MQRAVRILAVVAILAAVLAAGVAVGPPAAAGQQKYGAPKTVLHVVALKWKPEATEEQKAAVIEGIKTMAATIPGVKNIWIKPDRVQPREYQFAFAIEFESRAAADAYAEHPAHEAWEAIYLPLRAESRSLQITN